MCIARLVAGAEMPQTFSRKWDLQRFMISKEDIQIIKNRIIDP